MQPPVDPANWLLGQFAKLLNAEQYARLLRRYQLQRRHYSLFRSAIRARERLASYRQNPLSRMSTLQRQQAVVDRAAQRLAEFEETHRDELTD